MKISSIFELNTISICHIESLTINFYSMKYVLFMKSQKWYAFEVFRLTIHLRPMQQWPQGRHLWLMIVLCDEMMIVKRLPLFFLNIAIRIACSSQ